MNTFASTYAGNCVSQTVQMYKNTKAAVAQNYEMLGIEDTDYLNIQLHDTIEEALRLLNDFDPLKNKLQQLDSEILTRLGRVELVPDAILDQI